MELWRRFICWMFWIFMQNMVKVMELVEENNNSVTKGKAGNIFLKVGSRQRFAFITSCSIPCLNLVFYTEMSLIVTYDLQTICRHLDKKFKVKMLLGLGFWVTHFELSLWLKCLTKCRDLGFSTKCLHDDLFMMYSFYIQ